MMYGYRDTKFKWILCNHIKNVYIQRDHTKISDLLEENDKVSPKKGNEQN